MEKRKGSDRVPVPIEELERQLGIDQPRAPEVDTPTKPEIVVMQQCIVCHGEKLRLVVLEESASGLHRHRQETCSHCEGTGLEP